MGRDCELIALSARFIAWVIATQPLSANLDHNGAHARTAGIFPMGLLNFFKPEGSLDRHGDFSGPKPFKEQLQIRHEVLRRAAEAEEGGAFARPEEQILGQQFEDRWKRGRASSLRQCWEVHAVTH